MIEINNLYQGYGRNMIFKDFSISIESHKITSIIGASGCGKSTLLKTIGGILPFDKGTIKGVNKNCISFVFQEDRLLPWLSVLQNIELVLKNKNGDRKIVNEILEILDIQRYKEAKIDELSGGMQRRVAIARALAYDKSNKGDLLLLDEPFKGLDYKLREEITGKLSAEWKKYGKTVLMVTHDIHEAMELSDNVFELYGNPIRWQIPVD